MRGTISTIKAVSIGILCLFFSQFLSFSYANANQELVDGNELERQGKLQQVQKLQKLVNSLDNKVNEKGADAQGTNPLDGNPMLSPSTFHSRVVSTCLKWVGEQRCEAWIGAYASMHAILFTGADKSELEGQVGDDVQANKDKGTDGQDSGENVQYQIWNVKKKSSSSILDADNKLDFKNVKKMTLIDSTYKKSENVGYGVAQNQIKSLVIDENAGRGGASTPKEKVMVSPESLRLLARQYSAMFRRRLLGNLGAIRASSEGIETVLDNDTASCQQYLADAKKQTKILPQERLKDQANLEYQTQAFDLEQRQKYCEEVVKMSGYALAPRVVGDKVEATGAEGERYDEAAARLNLLAFDYAGKDPRTMQPVSSDFEFNDQDIQAERGNFTENAEQIQKVRETNANTILSYNAALKDAARGIREVAARNPFMADGEAQAAKAESYQIQLGSDNITNINGPTAEQKFYFRDVASQHPSLQPNSQGDEKNPPSAPADVNASSQNQNASLTITSWK